MTEWFARPVLHVSNVEASLRFYVEHRGFTVPWRAGAEGKTDVAQVDRQGCALISPKGCVEADGGADPLPPVSNGISGGYCLAQS